MFYSETTKIAVNGNVKINEDKKYIKEYETFNIPGADNEIVKFTRSGVKPGEIYKIDLNTDNWQFNDYLTGYTLFGIESYDINGGDLSFDIVESQNIERMQKSYLLTIPDNINTSGEIKFIIRGKKNTFASIEVRRIYSLETYYLSYYGGGKDKLERQRLIGLKKLCKYRITSDKLWKITSLPTYHSYIILEYVNQNGINEIFAYNKTTEMKQSYDFIVPDDIGCNGEIQLSVRADNMELVNLKIERISDIIVEEPEDIDVDIKVNSQIFKSVKLAWTDKDNRYESWPNSGVQADGDKIVIIYNSGAAHVDTTLSTDIYMRKKTTFSDTFTEKKLLLQHDGTHSYMNPSFVILNNGDYFVVASDWTSEMTGVSKFKMIKSSDKGNNWIDMGYVSINGEDLIDEGFMSIFSTSSGKLIAFSGGMRERKFVASDDNGATWRFVGDSFINGSQEGGFIEEDDYIYCILRNDNNTPALIKLNLNLTSYEVLYDFGEFNFPAYWNPTSIKKLNDGRYFLLGGSRRTDSDGKFLMYEAVITKQQLLNNDFQAKVILKYPAQTLIDWGYAQLAVASDNTVYGYFYGGYKQGTTQIYELF